MDGLTLIRQVKQINPQLPIIIITGFSTESSAIEAVNLGVAGYLTKPFRVPQVLAAAAKALGAAGRLIQAANSTTKSRITKFEVVSDLRASVSLGVGI